MSLQPMDEAISSVAILAGGGRLATEAAARLRRLGAPPLVITVASSPDPDLAREAGTYYQVEVGQWTEIKRRLIEAGIRRVVLLGKVPQTAVYDAPMDEGLRQILKRLPTWSPDAILGALVDDLVALGLEVLPQAWAVPHLVMPEGELTRSAPTAEELQDIALGFRVARTLAGLDVGQTVVVRDLVVTAVEAVEGTNACIMRGSNLAGGRTVVVKVRKPAQDARFDLPTLGLESLEVARQVGVRVLALEAGESLLVDREAVVQACDEAGISLVGVREEQALQWGG